MVEAADDAPAPAPPSTSTTASFPVVLYDGEREMDVGVIKIHPDLAFKQFQTTLSQMIGISYNNLTTYLVDSTKSKISPDRRKILITGKVNFSAIVRETNCFFLVVLKRSRRDRRRKVNKPSEFDLNWNHYMDTNMTVPNPYYYDDRFHDLLMRREDYMNLILNSVNSRYGFESFDDRFRESDVNFSNFPRIEDAYPRVRSMCEECTVAQKQGKVAEFHLCVYDEVVRGGFRSPAGPVSRPV